MIIPAGKKYDKLMVVKPSAEHGGAPVLETVGEEADGAATPRPAPKKIAIVGTCPESVLLAPYHDPEWTVWTCGPASILRAMQEKLMRIDAHFDVHPFEQETINENGGMPGVEYLRKLPKFYVQDEAASRKVFPNAVQFPKEEMLEKFGVWFFTSSVSWMLALALSQDPLPEEIGIWGADMAHGSEYEYQKPGALHFIDLAIRAGVKITVPPESCLLKSGRLYGYYMNSPMWKRIKARQDMLQLRMNSIDAELTALRHQVAAKENLLTFLRGAMDDLNYFERTWT